MNERRKHIDLFSGIGGWAVAAGWAGFETIGFAETKPYPSAVLKRHWPWIKNHGDIREVTAKKTGRCDLLTASPPCQPYAVGNKNRGNESDDRILWRELSDVVQDIRPTWFIGEEVSEFAQFHLDPFFATLEATGYTTGAVIIPACAIGGCPHRRDRLWFMAHTDQPGLEGYRKHKQRPRKRAAWQSVPSHLWGEPPKRIQRILNGFAPWPHRPARIQAIGNAIVPQVAYEILKRI